MPVYRFDAFKLNITASGGIANATDVIQALTAQGAQPSAQVGAYTRDLWRVAQERAPRSWFGQFRKFRHEDLPLVGAPGEEGEELEIAENAGLIEKNFFLIVPPHDILLWCVNGHANTPNQFTQFLSELSGVRVSADPVLQSDAMRRLMSGAVSLTKVNLRIARPTNPDWYPADDFSRELLQVLAQGGGDSLLLQAGVDGRLARANQHDLAGRWKRAIRTFVNEGLAKTARVEVMEDGIEYPIDLIADRLLTQIEVEHDGRYAPTASMLGALRSAWAEVAPTIEEVFGEEGHAIR